MLLFTSASLTNACFATSWFFSFSIDFQPGEVQNQPWSCRVFLKFASFSWSLSLIQPPALLRLSEPMLLKLWGIQIASVGSLKPRLWVTPLSFCYRRARMKPEILHFYQMPGWPCWSRDHALRTAGLNLLPRQIQDESVLFMAHVQRTLLGAFVLLSMVVKYTWQNFHLYHF